MKSYKKYLTRPYRLRRGVMITLLGIQTKTYNFIMVSLEWVVCLLLVKIQSLFLSKTIAHKRPLVLVCRNNMYGNDAAQVSTEKFMLDDTLVDVDVDVDVFYWDDDKYLIGNQWLFYRVVSKQQPDIVVLSSYSENNFTHPRLSLIKVFQNKMEVKFVALWWDTCSDTFIDSISRYIDVLDLNVMMDNPSMNMGRNLTPQESLKCIPMQIPLNSKNFNPQSKSIDVAFLGQIGSYRSYRKEVLFYLMKNNVSGFFSGFERDSQPTHDEYFDILARAKIGINFSYSVDKSQLKGRVFDTMLSGALLLEQKNDQIECYFDDGVDYVSFSSKEDLLEKIRYYLDHEDERIEISSKGRAKCIDVCNGTLVWAGIFKRIGFE